MNTADAQLSSELQELYLGNKEKLSDILFLEDETRFFQKLVQKVVLSPIIKDKLREIEIINSSLAELQNRRDRLKALVNSQQNFIEAMLKDVSGKIEWSLIEQNTSISTEIASLFGSDNLVKRELYVLVEQVLADEKAGHLLNA